MAEEKWTVFYGICDAGNQRPVIGWKTSEMVVLKPGSTTELKKNAAWNLEPKLTTAEPQECKFVTVVAESAEEACLVVDKYLSNMGGGFNKTLGEIKGVEGPSVKGNQVNGVVGKACAALSANITEVAVN